MSRKHPSANAPAHLDLPDLMKDQQERQTRLRHVQEFLSSPTFLDLSDLPVEVADDDEALAERQRDLTYRIALLRSLLELLEGEVKALDRLRNGTGESDSSENSST